MLHFRIILVVVLMLGLNTQHHLPAPNKPAKNCTIFTLMQGDKVFFCGNLDHPSLDGSIWFWPASKEGYGGVMHGYHAKWKDRSWIAYEGGMNEKGLAFDTNGLPAAKMKSHPEKRADWERENFWRRMLKKCASVKEAIKMAGDYNFGNSMDFQVHVADCSGDAVVISPGPDSELRFTRKKQGDGFLVSTNFNNANPKHRHGTFPCKRYVTAVDMLKKIKSSKNIKINYLGSILEAVHFEGASYNTIYSHICDLRGCKFYLYYFHQFNEAAVFDLKKELTRGERTFKIKDLVTQKTRDHAGKEYQTYKQAKQKQQKKKIEENRE